MKFVTAEKIAGDIEPNSDKIKVVFSFIIAYFTINTTGPTSEEIANALDVIYNKRGFNTSRSTIRSYLIELEARGLIEIPPGDGRKSGKIIVIGSEWRYNEAIARRNISTDTA